MSTNALSARSLVDEGEAQFTIEAILDPGVSFVCRISAAEASSIRLPPLSLWCAHYGPVVLANRWQPYDQPSAAAYMPWPFAEFERVSVGNGGDVLVQRAPRHSRASLDVERGDAIVVTRRKASPVAVEAHLLDLLRNVVASHSDEHVVAEALRSRCAGLLGLA